MQAWMTTSANLFVLKNSTKSSKRRPLFTKLGVPIWHPSCSTTSRRTPMKTAAVLLVAICFVPAMIYAQAVAYDYSKLYEQASPAVVQVSTDDGSGSGFLVTKFGHIATNYHVIRNSRYLAVQFPDGRKVKAAVAAVNPRYDMAILKVNSDVVKDIEPLPILPEDKESTIRVGIPVVAIGSPLNQKFLMTQGILSKVDETTVLGDFLLQSGNSGGPLISTDGEVI